MGSAPKGKNALEELGSGGGGWVCYHFLSQLIPIKKKVTKMKMTELFPLKVY